ISFSTAKASINGSSVVPGLPKTISTPSCLSRSRKARFPDMTGTGLAPRLRGEAAVVGMWSPEEFMPDLTADIVAADIHHGYQLIRNPAVAGTSARRAGTSIAVNARLAGTHDTFHQAARRIS